MTKRQTKLVDNLRLELLRANYPPIYAVDSETLIATEESILEHKKKLGLPKILVCGENGLYFKGIELLLKV